MTLLGMIVLTVIWGGSLFLAGGLVFMTAMLFDTGSQAHIKMLAMKVVFAYFPVTILTVIASWIAFIATHIDLAQIFMFVPVVHIGLYVAVMVWLFAPSRRST